MACTFERICALLAARNCYNGGQSVKVIAASDGKTESTIRRWLAKSDCRRQWKNIKKGRKL